MVADDLEEAAYMKILAAADEIRVMALQCTTDATAMLELARRLCEVAEQIRNNRPRDDRSFYKVGGSRSERIGTDN